MNKISSLFILITIILSACAPQAVTPSQPDIVVQVQPSEAIPTATADPALTTNTYTNSQFGLSFQFPASWYGPDEYISDSILRVAVGSDIVYPYGEVPEQPSTVTNSYLVVIQYSKNDQNTYWQDNYQTLGNLQDGESFSDGRGLIIRVSSIELGRFKGFEYISTLSENAQTEPSYSREVILVDEESNLITVSGKPNNVEVPSGTTWRDVYKMIDEQNLDLFHQIVDSITVQ